MALAHPDLQGVGKVCICSMVELLD
jgi:hypothetical protein